MTFLVGGRPFRPSPCVTLDLSALWRAVCSAQGCPPCPERFSLGLQLELVEMPGGSDRHHEAVQFVHQTWRP